MMYRRSPKILETLLNKGVVWRGRDRDLSRVGARTLFSTGLECLDRPLNGGWPSHTSIELCVPSFAVEWALLTQQLARVTRAGKLAVLVNPPHDLMAVQLLAQGVCLAQLWLIESRTPADWVAASVESLRTHNCGLVVAWEPKGLRYVHLRKCALASSDNTGLFFLVRNAFARRNASPASLRILLKQRQDDLEVQIFKHKGLVEPISLILPVGVHLLAQPPTKQLGARHPAVQKRARLNNVVHLGRAASLGVPWPREE